MLALLFALPVALSQEYIVSAGEPVELRVAGTWTRVIHTGDQWKVAFATNGSFWLQDLTQQTEGDPTSWALTGDRLDLQDRKDTKDHAILRCPDGTYLHIASANVIEQNDSAYAWRYDENFSIIASTTLAEGDTTRNHNDMVMVCSRLGTGVAFPTREARTNTFFPLDDALNIGDTFPLEDAPLAEGGAMLVDRDQDLLYHTGTDTFQQQLVIRTYDANWQSVNYQTLDVIDAPMRPFWPQRLLQVGDKFLLAFVARNDEGGTGDGGEGNIYVAVLDVDFQLLERHQITTYADNAGKAMRPWLERYGTQVLVSFDAETEHTVAELTIDAAAFGLDEDNLYADTAWSGSDTASEDDTPSPTAQGCGRRPTRSAMGLMGIGLALLTLRRKPTHTA